MTREKAIKVLEMFLHKQCDLGRTEFAYDQLTIWDAVKMASDALEQEPCKDAVSRAEVRKIAKEMFLEVANMELDVNTISDCISYTASKCREVLERKLQALPPVTLQELIFDKIRAEVMELDDINPDYPMDRTIHISRNEVLQIIDKYKA